jgi:L-histidine Nalpha-methyltransferase
VIGETAAITIESWASECDRRQWIEMRLRARRAMTVRVNALALDVTFAEGEEMRTEISAKFTPSRVRSELAAAGLTLTRWLTDQQGRFALSLAAPAR